MEEPEELQSELVIDLSNIETGSNIFNFSKAEKVYPKKDLFLEKKLEKQEKMTLLLESVCLNPVVIQAKQPHQKFTCFNLENPLVSQKQPKPELMKNLTFGNELLNLPKKDGLKDNNLLSMVDAKKA